MATTTKKTKQDILNEMEKMNDKLEHAETEKLELQAQIDNLKKQIDNIDKFKQYKDVSDELMLMKSAFKASGFTNEEAMALIHTSINATVNMNKR